MPGFRFLLACLLSSFATLVGSPAQAQITPDQTLGSETSIITPNVEVRGAISDLIEGGAERGPNLFHSFTDFNVLEAERIYLANPAGIDSILSRVTGDNLSNIFGTLGVDGTADLFLINPNGIVFGPDVMLDVEGSLFATTANAVALGDGVFSATAPAQSQLLRVTPDTSFLNYLTASSGDIVNRGQIGVGGNVTLAANDLALQSQLAAGENLSLIAANTVTIRDTTEVPFVAFAGRDLLVQGDQQVDIVALSHPESGLFSYGNIVLRSPNPVGGDAHYWSSGEFQVEQLDGTEGRLFSPIDPIIRALGDVTIGEYKGSSLHILAGGSVSLATAEIDAPEGENLGIDFLQETISLADGTVVEIDGNAQPTLDIRAGVRPEAIGVPPLDILTGFNRPTDSLSDNSVANSTPTSADINIGDVRLNFVDGVVLLTNQYQPNSELSEGSIMIDGGGSFGFGINATNSLGQGGSVFIDSRNNIQVSNSSIQTTAIGNVGDILLIADEDVTFDGGDGSRTTGAFSSIASGGQGVGGDVRIVASQLEVLNGARLGSLVLGRGRGGDIVLNIGETAHFEGINPIDNLVSGAFVQSEAEGQGGDILITVDNLEVFKGAQLNTSTSGAGNAGSIILAVGSTAHFDGSSANNSGAVSGAFSRANSGANGTGGDISVTADTLEISNGAVLDAVAQGQEQAGIAGNVSVAVDNLLIRDSSNIAVSAPAQGGQQGGKIMIVADVVELMGVPGNTAQSGLFANGRIFGRAGVISIEADKLSIQDGAEIQTSILSGANISTIADDEGNKVTVDGREFPSSGAILEGEAGTIDISASSIELVGADSQGEISDRISGRGGIFSDSRLGGSGGTISIETDSLQVRNGGQIRASTNLSTITSSVTSGDGDSSVVEGPPGQAGTISITASDHVLVSDQGSKLSVETAGNASQVGDLTISAERLDIINNGEVSANSLSESSGSSGNLNINVSELMLNEGTLAAETLSGIGGDINILATGKIVLSSDSQISATTQNGEGGDINIRSDSLSLEDNSQITARSFNFEPEPEPEPEPARVRPGNPNLDVEPVTSARLEELLEAINRLQEQLPNDPSLVPELSRLLREYQETLRNSSQSVASDQNQISTDESDNGGNAGNINIVTTDSLTITNSDVITSSELGSGGEIAIRSGTIYLFEDGDISTFVQNGEGSGGNITVVADAVVAFDDSDILAFATEGSGGNINLERAPFFGQNFKVSPPGISPATLDGNDQVNINASGLVRSGDIALPDVSFVENSLTELTDNLANPEALIANSCIAQVADTDSTFTGDGSEGIPSNPSESLSQIYSVGSIQQVPASAASLEPTHIAEPQSVYRLADGRLLMSRLCE